MLKLGRCWPWKTLSVHLKYNRNATSKGPQVNNKTIRITNTCRYEKGKITKGSSALRGYFSILILTTGMTKVSKNATEYSYTCINSDMNVQFSIWVSHTDLQKRLWQFTCTNIAIFSSNIPHNIMSDPKMGYFNPSVQKATRHKMQV